MKIAMLRRVARCSPEGEGAIERGRGTSLSPLPSGRGNQSVPSSLWERQPVSPLFPLGEATSQYPLPLGEGWGEGLRPLRNKAFSICTRVALTPALPGGPGQSTFDSGSNFGLTRFASHGRTRLGLFAGKLRRLCDAPYVALKLLGYDVKERSVVDGAGLATHVADDWPRNIVACSNGQFQWQFAASIKRKFANVSRSIREFVALPSQSAAARRAGPSRSLIKWFCAAYRHASSPRTASRYSRSSRLLASGSSGVHTFQ